ncbi:MAG: tetratricopeptide repeat protein [Vicinamibacterales bacterium]
MSVGCRLIAVLAVGFLASACSRDPVATSQKYVASGDEYAAKNNRDEAIIQYRNAIKARPDWPEPHYKLAKTYEAGGDYVNAYAEYARTADMDPSNVDAQIRAGTLLLVAGEFSAARTRAELALKADAKNVAAHILLGNAHAGLNEPGSALRQIEQAINLEPSYAPAWTALGAVKFVGGERDEAAAAFRKAVELAPQSVDARLALANFQWASGNVKETESTLKAALALDDKNMAAHRTLALLYLSTNRAPLAEPHFQRLATDARGQLALADYYMGLGRAEDALKLIGTLEKSADVSTVQAARLRRASLAYAGGRKPEAHKILDRMLKERPRNAEARVAKARMLMADGAIADALVQAREAVKADPTLPSTHYTVGLAALADRKFDEAEKAFEEVTRLSPRATGAQLQLSRLRLARGEAAGALTAARDAAQQRPDSPEAAILVSRSLRAQGDVAKAWAELSSRVAAHPKSTPLHVEMGWVALERKQFDAARKSFNEALTQAPNSIEAQSGLVATHLAAGEVEKARSQVDSWRRAAPGNKTLDVLAARVELTAGKAADAERILQSVVASDATHLEAYELLGRLYVSQKRLDKAIEQYEAIAERSPSPTGPRTMAAMLHESRGDRARAKQVYEAIVARDPRAGIAANNLAWMYAEDGRLDEALRLARVAKDQLRRRPEGEDTLGWVQLRKGAAGDAIASFSRAVERSPNNPVYHYHLGLAYLQSGDKQRGRSELQRALEISKDFNGADDARKQLAQSPNGT